MRADDDVDVAIFEVGLYLLFFCSGESTCEKGNVYFGILEHIGDGEVVLFCEDFGRGHERCLVF